MNPRTRRLVNDQKRVGVRFKASKFIQVEPTGNPADSYRITYKVKGLIKEANGTIKERDNHQVEIKLDLSYPRGQPKVKMLTPIFHPNINSTRVCIADNWTPQEFLDDLIIRIGQMITYQDYNSRSPLDGKAARWATQNDSRFPVDDQDLFPPQILPKIQRRGPAMVTIGLGERYEDKGATAKDEIAGSLTEKIKTTGQGFHTGQTGTHIIRYNVKNKAGVAAKEVTRTVVIEDKPKEDKTSSTIRIVIEDEEPAPQSSSTKASGEVPQKSKIENKREPCLDLEQVQEHADSVGFNQTEDLQTYITRQDDCEASLQTLKQELEEQRAKSDGIEQELQSIKEKHQSAINQIDTQAEKTQKGIEQLKTDLHQQVERVAQLRSENESLKEHLSKQLSDQKQIKRDIKEVSEKRGIDLAEQSKQVGKLDKNLEDLKKIHADQMDELVGELHKQINQWKAGGAAASPDISERIKRCEALVKSTVDALTQKVEAQIQKLSEQIKKWDSRSSSSTQPLSEQPINLAKLKGKALYLWVSEAEHQPITFEELTQGVESGKINPDTYIYHDDLQDWTALKHV